VSFAGTEARPVDRPDSQQSLGLVPRQAGLLRRFARVRLAGVALFLIVAFVVMAIFAPLIAPYDPLKQDLPNTFSSPSFSHPFGTDYLGRDILSRIIYGSRVSILVGLVAVGIAVSIGVPVGLFAGYIGGLVDDAFMRIVDGVMAFPTLILALGIVAVLGPGILNVMIAIGFTAAPVYVRLARAQTLSVKTYDFVIAATSVGCSTRRILFVHILPNILAPIIVAATLGLAGAVLAEAGLGFLGVGVVPPTPTWGSSLNQGFRYLNTAPGMSLFPGFAIFLLVLSFNFAGDALRDVLDPRLRGSI
jgi:peptide/nickel transport system permease protein